MCLEEHDTAFETGPASFRWPAGGAWSSRAEMARAGGGAWRHVAGNLATRLAGVSRAPRGALNLWFARKNGGRDSDGRWPATTDGDQNGYPL